jgi:hypothetical protein
VIQQKVDKIFLVVNSQFELVPDKGKLRPHFKQEGPHIVYQRRFKLPLGMFIRQVYKVEGIFILYCQNRLLFDSIRQCFIKIRLS